MKIQVVSDLHLDFSPFVIQNEGAEVLVLAGDIVEAIHLHKVPFEQKNETPVTHSQIIAKRFRDFISDASLKFEQIVVVAGNHEFYDGRWYDSIDWIREEYHKYPNVQFLERELLVFKGVVFVGGTLWTDMNRNDPLTLHASRDMMNDYKCIRNDRAGFTPLKPFLTSTRHAQTLGYFNHALSEFKDHKCIVVSHHAPTRLSIDERFANETLMNGNYYSDLSDFILDRPQIALWVHGHVHQDKDYTMGNTRVVCSPRGYVSSSWGAERPGFVATKVVEI